MVRIIHRCCAPAGTRCLLVLLMCMLRSFPASAQDATGLPELNSLKPASAPAFILLGVAPSAIERPQTPSDIAFSFVNQSQSFSALPQNYAAEFAPYWLFPRPLVGWRSDTTRTPGESFARTATVSLATADIGTESAPVTGLAIGGSAYLLSGRMSTAAQQRFRQIEVYLARRDSLESALGAAQTVTLQAEYGTRIADAATRGDTQTVRLLSAELTSRVDALRLTAQQDSAYRRFVRENVVEEMQEATPRREGLFWGVAGGASWGYANAAWATGELRRVGLWTTLSYEGTPISGQTTFTPMAVIRLLAERGDSASSVVDAGGRFVLSSPTYSASLETVFRLPMEDEAGKNLYRVAGVLEYQVREDLWLTATFGRDYQSRDSGSLLAQLGVKFHVTEDRYEAPSR
ncbi:MAG TPA: hypothetical protein VGB24_18445 [Longimicrobium sp.]|jgi:hypothetical protein|uniref:hypothetical protein n=1 Tax=Longimicrobium sp. TaxID=2029185 RepID=UPI002EDACB2F